MSLMVYVVAGSVNALRVMVYSGSSHIYARIAHRATAAGGINSASVTNIAATARKAAANEKKKKSGEKNYAA